MNNKKKKEIKVLEKPVSSVTGKQNTSAFSMLSTRL